MCVVYVGIFGIFILKTKTIVHCMSVYLCIINKLNIVPMYVHTKKMIIYILFSSIIVLSKNKFIEEMKRNEPR